MFTKRLAALMAALVLFTGAAQAQTWFPTKIKGTFSAEITATAPGILVSVDGKAAGVAPLTVWVLPGPHTFTFTSANGKSDTIAKTFMKDGAVNYQAPEVVATFPVTVNTNVPAALALDGVAFGGNQVQAAAGNHVLTVQAPGYETLTYPFQVQNKALVLNFTLTALGFPLTVNSNVPAAWSIDGTPFGGNQVQVPPGAHVLTAQAPGYEVATFSFTMPSKAYTVNLTLNASTFPLTVNANVPAAWSIDGAAFGGNQVQVTPGAHVLTAQAPGYEPATFSFTMPSKAYTVNLTLKSVTFALTVNSNVPAAWSIDGVAFGGNQIQVTAGPHVLTAQAPGYEALNYSFTMPSKALTINLNLVALTGTVLLNTDKLFKAGTPSKVFIDGAEVKGNSFVLPAGVHQIRLTWGTQAIETVVNVAAGQNQLLVPSVTWDFK